MTTSERLKSLRKKKRSSLREVADFLGVAVTTYRAWEMGRKIPAEALIRLAYFYKIPSATLLGDQDSKHEALRKAIYHLEEGLEQVKSVLDQ